MDNLETQLFIKRENLDETFYFQSILHEAYGLKLLSDSQFEKIQRQSIQLLTKQAERYTGKDSSSVKLEIGETIQQSIFYTIGIYLKSLPNPDRSLTILEQKSLLEIYQQGKELIETQLDRAKKMLTFIQDHSLVINNYAYNDTIQHGIPIFFPAYDACYAAQDTPASIDYPLSNDKMNLVGIEYIYSYLQKLILENEFCKNFTEYEIDCLLRGYDAGYQDLLINIFELVLTNAVGSILSNKSMVQLDIQPLDRNHLQHKLENLSNEELCKLLKDAHIQLCKDLNIKNELLINHIGGTVIDLTVRLKNALENNCLESIFVNLKEHQSQPISQFDDGEKMNDELFRKVANAIRECRLVSDKIVLIQREIHSITDLVDILAGYCIFDNEYDEVFQSLGDKELAILIKRLPSYLLESDLLPDTHKEWQLRLNKFYNEIDKTRKDVIKDLIIHGLNNTL